MTYTLVTWPESEIFMDCEEAIEVQGESHLMVPTDIYNEYLKSMLE